MINRPSILNRACLITLHSNVEIFQKGHPAVEVLYTIYPIVARALGLAAARAKLSCIQVEVMLDRCIFER